MPWGSTQPLKNEYQDIPGGKGGRCVRMTTLQPSCTECLVIWSLNRPEPSRHYRPVIGAALHFYSLDYKAYRMFMCGYLRKSSPLIVRRLGWLINTTQPFGTIQSVIGSGIKCGTDVFYTRSFSIKCACVLRIILYYFIDAL